MTDPAADRSGRVILVGGGPGAEDLITVRGLDRLMAADVVITDRLAPVGLLARLGPDVEMIDAARAPGRPTLTYDEIVRLMIDRASAGKTVVRLKGGDPFVFAHGAQEVRSCTDAGIPVEVVPGVTSATAAPALAGVPLTSSEGATGFVVVSGHLDPADPACRTDWAALARSGMTIVILMGMRHLPAIAARLIEAGMAADTSATCVADASLPGQRSVTAKVPDLAEEIDAAGLINPAVVIVAAGQRRPGRRILVLGGSASGKSGYAEGLLAGEPKVTYVATARRNPDDPEWADRIDRHRQRRPPAWVTAETCDLAEALSRDDGGALLIDSMTTWLAQLMDDCGCWADPPSEASARRLAGAVDALIGAWSAASVTALAVSDEVGSGVVPEAASGRAFRDSLGQLNQRLAVAADEVWLVTAGIPCKLR
jgi:uroporphyrin-III C-methyltransferase